MAKPIGYYVECEHTHMLMERFGDRLEALTANDKLGLIAAISLWLSIDDDIDRHWDIPAVVHTQLFPQSQSLSLAASILEDISIEDAQGLMAALVEQVREGVYAS